METSNLGPAKTGIRGDCYSGLRRTGQLPKHRVNLGEHIDSRLTGWLVGLREQGITDRIAFSQASSHGVTEDSAEERLDVLDRLPAQVVVRGDPRYPDGGVRHRGVHEDNLRARILDLLERRNRGLHVVRGHEAEFTVSDLLHADGGMQVQIALHAMRAGAPHEIPD